MRRIIITLLFILLVINCPQVEAKTKKSDVLLLNSYHRGYKWSDDIELGLRQTLLAEYPSAVLHVEYFDTKRVYNSEYINEIYKFLKIKYRDINVDVVVTSDDNAFNFIKKYKDELFPSVPIIFCGVNYFDQRNLGGMKGITGVNEEADIRKGLDLALKLHPRTEKIVFVNDNTTTGLVVLKEIKKQIERLSSRYEIEVLGDISSEELFRKVGEYNPEKTIIYYTIFFRDNNNKSLEVGEAVRGMREKTEAPIYGTWSFSLGYGIVGGFLTSGLDQGKKAGKMVGEVLKGVDVNSIPVLMETPKKFMFDWNEIERLKINKNLIPKDSVIINKPVSFFEENKVLIYALGIMFLLLVMFILILFLWNINRKQKIELLNEYNQKLEKKVKERTESLENSNKKLEDEIKIRKKTENEIIKKNESLNEFNQIVIGRELKMVELKEKIKELENKLSNKI